MENSEHHRPPQGATSGADAFRRALPDQKRFGAWATVPGKDGLATKVPFTARGQKARSNDPGTWRSRAAADELLQQNEFDGLAVFLGDLPDGTILCGIDLDTCRDPESGAWTKAWAPLVIEQFGSYTEISPSKTGAKIYFIVAARDRARLLALLGGDCGQQRRGRSWKEATGGKHPPAIEFFTGGRFFAVTHEQLPDAPGDIRTIPIADLEWLFNVAGPSVFAPALAQDKQSPSGSEGGDARRTEKSSAPDDSLAMREKAVLVRLAEFGTRRPKLAALLAGETSQMGDDKSRSARDMALVGYCKDAGLDRADAQAALYAFPYGAGREHHDAGDFRYFDRAWQRSRADRVGDAAAPKEIDVRSEIGLLSEDAAARQFTARYEGELLFDHDWGRWLQWIGTHWRANRTALAFHFARELVRELAANKSPRDKLAGGKAAFATSVEKYARATPVFARTAENWDSNLFLLGTPGGTVDLRSGVMQEARREDCITKLTRVAPADSAVCPMWVKFLRDATGDDEELIAFLQEWSGYCLTGDVSEHALVFICGDGGNGKGVFINGVNEILGDYATTAAMDTFEASRSAKHPTDLAMLRGARLVTASETEEGRAWAESRIKAITGGDPISARFMRQDFFTYQPQFKLTIVGNHMPVLSNVDEAAKRRFNVVPFTRKPANPDKNLPEKLRAEYPGILRWMLDGCTRWRTSGLSRPAIVTQATAEYFADQDLFGQWLSECCNVNLSLREMFEPGKALYGSWREFAEKGGEQPGSTKSFAHKMRARGILSDRTGRQRLFRFVSLKPENQADDG